MKTCLIGNNIDYSLSPEIHHYLGDDSYTVLNLEEKELSSFFKSADFDGFNVTFPFKEKVIQYIDELDETAKAVGAVNTVVLKNGRYYGYNTDAYGFERLLAENAVGTRGKTIMVLGSGGASKAVRYILEKQGANVIVVSRTGEINYSNCYNFSPDIIINATPVGNINNFKTLLDIKQFPKTRTVIDLSYNPIKPRLLEDAEKLGKKCISGLDMLIFQAEEAHSLFFGVKDLISSEPLRKNLIEKMRNIVLIGPPGTGKTTVGRALAKEIGYKFTDIDEEIEKCGGKITEIFRLQGENYFRKLETDCIKAVALKNNYVISCGGGVVLSEENMDYLSANGVIVLLDRDVSAVDIPGRPLIKSDEDIKRLLQERKSLYHKYAQLTVENNKTVKECAELIKKSL